jgi:ribosome assembly protein YihI (activator of Der GTPase)
LGIPIARTTIQSITGDELATEEVQKLLNEFDLAIQEKIGDKALSHEQLDVIPRLMQGMNIEDEDESYEPFAQSMPEADEFDAESFDAYIGAEVIIPKGDNQEVVTVIGRK